MASVKRYQRQYGTRAEMDILRETAPTVASLLMIKPDAPPRRTTNDLIPLVTQTQPQFSLDQLTIDFLTDPTNQVTSQTTQIVRDGKTVKITRGFFKYVSRTDHYRVK